MSSFTKNFIVMKKILYLTITSLIGMFSLSACNNEIPIQQQQHLQENDSAHELSSEQQQPQEDSPVTELSQNSTDQLLFYCQTENRKRIELYDLGDTIRYSFGPDNDPEIVLDVPRDQASTYQWAGVGRSMYYSVDIPNANTVYTVFISEDRLSEERPVTGGVDVSVDNEYVATVNCADDDIISNLMGVDLQPSD
ncbi:MAG: hypothetical protein EA342_10960 [Leptolyngbya sp. LCM1.Bin17]|nr:MAG: hypothetical protein EA342_10960 [Leptolyngbya sp. LCM1.Bin17]